MRTVLESNFNPVPVAS